MGDLKAIAHRMYEEAVNGGNIDLFDEILAEDFVEHEEPMPGMPPTRDTVKQFLTAVRNGFPDFHMAVEDMLQEGNKIAARIIMTGTHLGEFMGIPATGNKVEVQTIDFLEFRGDQMIAHWGVTDTATMMQQLGVMEPPG